jgi:hypothetical protein
MNAPQRYKRAPGYGRHAMGHVRLWFGDSDLLQVTAVPGRESYERMPYSNIQAVLLTPTKTWHWRLVIWLVLCAIISLICLANSVGIYEMMFFLLLPLLLLVIELTRGPICECYVFTGVERYRLYPWSRKRVAMRGLRQLSERVRAAQGATVSL